MNHLRIIILRDIKSKEDFVGFARRYGVFADNKVFLRRLFEIMGFGGKALSAAIKRYVRQCEINLDSILIEKHGSLVVYKTDIDSAYKMVSHFQSLNLIYGHGIRDVSFPVKVNGKLIPSYRKWCGMLERCYSDKWHKKKPSYEGCKVSPDWLLFSGFHAWFCKHNIDGYVLDKDLLSKGNKTYSQDTCLFLPERINGLLINRALDRGMYPIGVIYRKDRKVSTFEAAMMVEGKRKHLGFYDCPQKAFLAYKKAKEAFIKEVAQDYFWRGEIDKRVYDALCAYEVEVDD